jgi:hypothetical protein
MGQYRHNNKQLDHQEYWDKKHWAFNTEKFVTDLITTTNRLHFLINALDTTVSKLTVRVDDLIKKFGEFKDYSYD